MQQRVVFLSDHNAHGLHLARVFAARGMVFDAVLVQSVALKSPRAGLGKYLRSWISLARAPWRFARQHQPSYRGLSPHILRAGPMNSARMRRILQKLAPDYLVIGCNGILSADLIATARHGVLNAHPGLLPWLRGSGTVGHALGSGVAIGATLHFIDAGIDTGAIVERRLLTVQENAQNLPALEKAAAALGVQMMADAVERILRHEPLAATPQTARYPLLKWPDANGRRALNALAQKGRAHELFAAWQSCTSGAPDWVLPPECVEAPAPIALAEKP